MDPASAFGLAANIIQFIDFAGGLISIANDIRQDGSPASTSAEPSQCDLDALARKLRPIATSNDYQNHNIMAEVTGGRLGSHHFIALPTITIT